MTIDTDSAASLSSAYDFIVVGGGTAGLVVANRLSEDPGTRVLVLEAGTNRLDDPRITIPALAATVYEDPDFDWDFKSVPQDQLNGRQLLENKGRTLGGSSAINIGMVIYPSQRGFNAWAELGNPGWSWVDFAPYVRKFHTATEPSRKARELLESAGGKVKYEQGDQGSSGPVQVSWGEDYTPFHAAWLKTFEELGYPLTDDPIKGNGCGAFVNPGIIDPATHTRSHAGAAYFNDAAQKRENLRVVTGAHVEKVLLEKRSDSVVATGVQISKDGTSYSVSAVKEVILAAGATQTPQLIELSGIGDPKLLQSHGIDVIVSNENVGENLQDHGIVSFSYEVADGQPSGDMARIPEVAAAAMAAYQQSGAGPLGMVPTASAFLPCPDLSKEQREELLKTHLDGDASADYTPAQKKQYEALRRIVRDEEEPTCQYIFAPFQLLPRAGPSAKGVFSMSHPGFFVSVVSLLSYPFSRGSVHIRDSDPKVPPAIDHGILRHPIDLEMHGRHAVLADRVAETEPFASLLKKGGKRLHTPERLIDVEKSKELCRDLILSMYHTSGTCAMMPREDGGVVSPRLKVYGTQNLRVVDASLFPLEPRGNIQATVFAVAEKAADLIKEDWGM